MTCSAAISFSFSITLADRALLTSAHDVSEGGLAVALAECTFGQSTERPIGATIDASALGLPQARLDLTLFAEQQGTVILSAPEANVSEIRSLAEAAGCTLTAIGTVGTDRLSIGALLNEPVSSLYAAYSRALPEIMEQSEAAAAA